MSIYEKMIRENSTYSPRHVEAFMRAEFGTLDNLSARKFKREIKIAEQCIDAGGNDAAESLANSYGM